MKGQRRSEGGTKEERGRGEGGRKEGRMRGEGGEMEGRRRGTCGKWVKGRRDEEREGDEGRVKANTNFFFIFVHWLTTAI